jgi:hypothetical protein
MTRTRVLAVVVVVAGATGCPAPVYDDELGLSGVPIESGSLAGVFGLQAMAVDQADVPLLGKVDTGGITASLVRRTWRGPEDADAYDEVGVVCAVENFETGGLLTVIAASTIQALPAVNATLLVTHEAGSFQRRPYRERWALRDLADDEPLPADVDSRVYFDMESDGKPGATVQASGLVQGEVYVAQRKTVEQEGVVRSVDELVGLSRVRKEGVVLGATNDFLKTESKRTPHPDPRQSWSMEIRLSDDADCHDVIAAQESGALPRRSPLPGDES